MCTDFFIWISITPLGRVLEPDGRWIKPLLLGVIDDHSRLGCHLQCPNLYEIGCVKLAAKTIKPLLPDDVKAPVLAKQLRPSLTAKPIRQ